MSSCRRGQRSRRIDWISQEKPDVFASYDYVLFLDDDIEISAAEISEFFALMRERGLDLAQPALTRGSDGSFPLLFQERNSPSFRHINYVEIMMPALSKRALAANRESFGQGISGFGVDALIGEKTRRLFGPNVAVIDAVAARHERKIDLDEGPLYRFLAAKSINPGVEMWTILAENNIEHGVKELKFKGLGITLCERWKFRLAGPLRHRYFRRR
jgi:hypothetical protein